MKVTCVRTYLLNDPHSRIWLFYGNSETLMVSPGLGIDLMLLLQEEHFGEVARLVRRKGALPPAGALREAAARQAV